MSGQVSHPSTRPSLRRAGILSTLLVVMVASGCSTTTSRPSARTSVTPSPAQTTRPSATPTPEPFDLLAGITVTPGDETIAADDSNALTVDVASLTPATLTSIDQELTPIDINLTMPRFNIASSDSLIPLLEPLGMTDAFTAASDLSGIEPSNQLHVGALLQRALIHVDEVGTTAAAATVVVGLGAGGAPPYTLIAIDHPFLFVIRDTISGAILFTAQVDDPSATS